MSFSLNTVDCSPTMAPPSIFGAKFNSLAACRMPDRTQRIGTQYDKIRFGGLQRANDRREIGRARRERLVVDDVETIGLRVFARTSAGVAAELGVLGRERDGLRLRLLLRATWKYPSVNDLAWIRPGSESLRSIAL